MKISLRRSRIMLKFLLLTHTAAFYLLYLLDFSLALTAFSALLVIASLLFYCQYNGWLFEPVRIQRLWINQDGFWFWADNAGREQGPMQLKRSVILAPVIAIYLEPANARFNRSLIIARDTVSNEDWRQLRLKLRDPASWD